MRKGNNVGEPPEHLEDNEAFAKVKDNRGNAFEVEFPESSVEKVRRVLADSEHANTLLVSIAPQLRSSYFVLRNSLVIVSLERIGGGRAKGEITNVVADKRQWQKSVPEWPVEWTIAQPSADLSLPPSWSEEEPDEEEEEG